MSKNIFLKIVITFISLTIITSCSEKNKNNKTSYSTVYKENDTQKVYLSEKIKELSDEEYPNNPDIAIRSKISKTFNHSRVEIVRNSISDFTVTILPENNKSDTVIFENIKLMEWIPSVPFFAKKDPYLEEIGIVNQEWNRMQVNFNKNQFKVKGNNLEGKQLVRADLARNCINAYLWEIIFYNKEDNKNKPCYHGWFDFPKDLYAELFTEKNNLNYEKYKAVLEEWKDPKSQEIKLEYLREVKNSTRVNFTNQNNKLFPLKGERKKKKMNIMFPKQQGNINSFLSDSTLYATFSKPGFYNQKEPRKTYLSKLANLAVVTVKNTISKNETKDKTFELELKFENQKDTTQLIIGGLKKENIPVLSPENVNKGFQMPMGISNHSFYTNYKDIEENSNLNNPFFAFILDKNNKWLDSHKIGIDGPMMHFDNKNPNLLHLWILSFERHSFVGHYIIDLTEIL